ncbi:hypothetical protein DJ021_00840 [Phenylobacterium hankyongense]|uniref:Uncharacterized protein n=1 Tax=Phenylobacterium hankyongense TaxID=1813876 RepID=A0A328AW23_9CAUL|nr:hypothetical protein [Phenylobacterium hankyongense]RAK58445.1 hypothetical protein DJ021_00840 [Phenylobacterium hankyongense]
MEDSESQAPDHAPQDASSNEDAHDEAQRAASGLKDQIAALRAQVRDAQDTLRDPRRQQERRTFKR